MKRDNSKITKKLKKIYNAVFRKYYESFTEFLKCKWAKMFKIAPPKCKTRSLNKKLKNRKLRYSEKQLIKDEMKEYNSSCSSCELFHNNMCQKESVCSEDTIYKDFRD